MRFFLKIFNFCFSNSFCKSGGEASIVAEVVEVEENSTQKMRTVRIPPVLTVNKTASYAVYELTYIRVREYPFSASIFASAFFFPS